MIATVSGLSGTGDITLPASLDSARWKSVDKHEHAILSRKAFRFEEVNSEDGVFIASSEMSEYRHCNYGTFYS
jgi:hypothetical protein